ncbi:MAG TPA: LapA family protein [Nitrospirota bacterium]|nr:LapA family protein [Nitrospirota bacterium]
MFVTILLVIVIVIVALFSVQNAIPVSISFLNWRFDASLAVISLLFFLAGMIAGMVVLFWIRMRRTARKRSETRQKRSDGEGAPNL